MVWWRTDRWADGLMDGWWTNRWNNRWMDAWMDGTPGRPPGGQMKNGWLHPSILRHLAENVCVFSGLPGYAGIIFSIYLMARLLYEGVRPMRGGSEWRDVTWHLQPRPDFKLGQFVRDEGILYSLLDSVLLWPSILVWDHHISVSHSNTTLTPNMPASD